MPSNGIKMTGSLGPLPDFAKPPVAEVALSIQFEPLAGFRVAHFGLFWALIQDRFPKTQEQPAIPPAVERFGVRVMFSQAQVQFGVGAMPTRCWFLDTSETELLQLQSDRLIHNWRKDAETSSQYPHYGTLREKLREEFATFDKFVEREKIGQLVPNQCELTYINHVFLEQKPHTTLDMSKVLFPWQGRYSDSFLPPAENFSANLSFVIPGPTGPGGRLYVSATPSLRISDNQPLIVLQLVGRGAPEGVGIDGVFRFLDKAHEWGVRGFTSITSPEMHALWGRTR